MSTGETQARILSIQVLGELSTALEAEEMSQNDFMRQSVHGVDFAFVF